MRAEMKGRGTPARGTVCVPGDKSLSHRGLLFGALADGTTTLSNLGNGADVRSTRACLEAMGVSIRDRGATVVVNGRGHRALTSPSVPLNCGNSGTTMRLLSGVVAGAGIDATLFGDESLNKRPMGRILEPLTAMGASCQSVDGLAPLQFSPASLKGTHHKIEVASAQVLSCLLLAGLYAKGPTVVEMPPGARDHTQRLLAGMGATLEVRPGFAKLTPSAALAPLGEFAVPGDPSSAAFFAAAAALHRGSEVRLQNVSLNPTRLGFFKVIERMGVEVERSGLRDQSGEPVGDLVVRRRGELKPITIERAEVPSLVDELPVLAVLASVAAGVSEIRGAAELRVKESDRIDAMTRGLRTLSVEVDEHDDGWTIDGGRSILGGRVETFHDHRIAMSFAIAALAAREPVTIDGSEWIATSFPAFLPELAKLTDFDLRESER